MTRTARTLGTLMAIAALALLYTPTNATAHDGPNIIVIPEVLHGPDPILLVVDFPTVNGTASNHSVTVSVDRGGLELRIWTANVTDHYETSFTLDPAWGRGWYNVLIREGNRTWASRSIQWDYSMAEIMDNIGGDVDRRLMEMESIVAVLEETKVLLAGLLLVVFVLDLVLLQHIVSRKRGVKSILDRGLRVFSNVRWVHFWGARGGVFTDNDRDDKEWVESRNRLFTALRGLPSDWDHERLTEIVRATKAIVLLMRIQHQRWMDRNRRGRLRRSVTA